MNEQFVAGVLARMFEEHRLAPHFALLAPHKQSGRLGYTLFIELPAAQTIPPGLSPALECALIQNFHYAYCRQLDQLAASQIMRIKDGAGAYLHHCQRRGRKLGNIKPALLDNQTGWETVFEIA